MNSNVTAIEHSFARMGARVKFVVGNRFQTATTFNVLRDRQGEYFDINQPKHDPTEIIVLDVKPQDRHLVLMTRFEREKHRYLMGHDERHWFIAGIPEQSRITTVRDAKNSLKPSEVIEAQVNIPSRFRDKRKNDAFIRQGEWFFIPRPNFMVYESWDTPILYNEPIVRSRGGKPHFCQELYRLGGETVYVSRGNPQGLTDNEYRDLDDRVRSAQSWTVMKRNPSVWVRGTVRHPDHATITLNGWHQVHSNTEHLSYAMRFITFLD